jgi:hypothetical protein
LAIKPSFAPKTFPENKNARTILPGALSYKKEYTTAVKYFWSTKFQARKSASLLLSFRAYQLRIAQSTRAFRACRY